VIGELGNGEWLGAWGNGKALSECGRPRPQQVARPAEFEQDGCAQAQYRKVTTQRMLPMNILQGMREAMPTLSSESSVAVPGDGHTPGRRGDIPV
jgi:hypothetical protein